MDSMNTEIQKSVANAAAALKRATMPLDSIAQQIRRSDLAEFAQMSHQLTSLFSADRRLTEKLAAMSLVKEFAESRSRFAELGSQMSLPLASLGRQLAATQEDAIKRATEAVTQGFAAYDKLASMRISDQVTSTVSALREASDAAQFKLGTYWKSFERFQTFLETSRNLLPASQSLSQQLADVALKSLPFRSLPWREPPGLLSMMEEPVDGALLSWAPHRDRLASELALIHRPTKRPDRPRLIVDVEVTCFMCGGPLLTQESSYEWQGESRLEITLPIIPVCAVCLQRSGSSRNYLDELMAVFERYPQEPRFEILPGGNEGSGGQEKRHDHLRLIKREPDSQDEDED